MDMRKKCDRKMPGGNFAGNKKGPGEWTGPEGKTRNVI